MAEDLKTFLKRWSLRLLGATLALVAIACGGGGGGGSKTLTTTGGGSGQGIANLAVAVSLPSGYHASAGGLFISGGLLDKTPVSGSTVTIKSWQQSRQLVAAIDAQGNPVMLGYVAPGHAALSPNSTAVVLVYFAMAAYGAPDESQEAVYEAIEQDPDLARVSADVTAELQASGNLSNPNAKFRSTTLSVAAEVLGGTNAVVPGLRSGGKAKPLAVTINPDQTTKSGVQVIYGSALNQIQASNKLRRRVMLFVDQVSTTDASGAVQPAPLEVQEQEIAPASGQVNSSDLLGNLGFDLQTTFGPAVTLPAVPTNLSAVNYKVTAAGGGSGVGEAATLDSKEQADLTAFLQRSFVKDFFLPVMNRLLVANTLSQTSIGEKVAFYSLLENAVDTNSAIAQQFVAASFPNAVSEMQGGDYRGANSDIMTALKDPSKLNQFANFYSQLIATANLPGYTGTSSRFSFVLAWISHALVAPDTGSFVFPQFSAYDASNRIDSWQITANNFKVTITPATSTVDSNNAQQLTSSLVAKAVLPNGVPQGDTLVYSWSTTGKHGDLTIGSTAGNSFPNNASDTGLYGATTGLTASQGDDQVTVSVSLKDSAGNITPIGGAVATVTVKAQGDITLVPNSLSVEPGATTNGITASTHFPENLTSGKASLHWYCANKLGFLNAPTTPTAQTTVTYTAGANMGSETVNCDYLYNGVVTSTSSMTVHIEKQPTIGFGQLVVRGYDFMSGNIPYSTATAAFRIPKVPGVKLYSVHCYNFNDPAAYGDHYDFSIGADGAGADADLSPDGHQLGTVGADGTFYKLGPGQSSSKFGIIGEVQANVASRLAGIVIQVTMSY